jgi:hypothetical protein
MATQVALSVAGQLLAMTAWFFQAWVANGMALRRRRSTKAWVWLTVVFGPLSLLTLKLLPARTSHA